MQCAQIRGATTNYHYQYLGSSAGGSVDWTISDTYEDGLAIAFIFSPSTTSIGLTNGTVEHGWAYWSAWPNRWCIASLPTDGTAATFTTSGGGADKRVAIFSFEPAEPEADNPRLYTGWYGSDSRQILPQFASDANAVDDTAMYCDSDDSTLVLPMTNPDYGLGGIPIALKYSVLVKSDSDDATKLIIQDIFEPWGSKSGYSRVTNSGSGQDLGTTYAWITRMITQTSRGEDWLSYDETWYQDVGLKSSGLASDIYVDAVVGEVARAEPETTYSASNAWRFAPGGYLVSSWIHTHLIDVPKYFSSLKAFARNVNTTDKRIYIDYRLDTDTTWTHLADSPVTSETASETSLYKTDYATGKKIQIRFRFETNDMTSTPDMIAWVLETVPKVPRRRVFTAPIRLQAYRENIVGGITYESMGTYYQSLVDLVESPEPVTVRSGNPVVNGTLVEVVGLDDERIIENPEDPEQVYVVANLTFIEVD
jgi:hypothetical protein